MENRFGLKDLVMAILLLAIIVSIWLAMVQYDRQRVLMHQFNTSLELLTTEQAKITRLLAQLDARIAEGGGIATRPIEDDDPQGPDPFMRLRQAEAQPDFARGDSYIEAFGVAPDKLTPLLSSDVYASVMQARVLEPLVSRDPQTLEYLPLLAESWEIDQENLTIRFKLRRGVTFSDGTEMTADDVVFTYDWIMNPEVAAPRERAYYRRIASVRKIDTYTVEFSYDEPYYEWFDLAGGMAVLPAHFYGKLTPEQFNKQPGMLMGTGPYRLRDPENWRPGDPLMLVRNARYWGEPGTFDRLVFRIIQQEANELTAFRNRDIDALGAEPEQYVKLIEDERFMAGVHNFVLDHRRQGYSFIGWNQKRGDKATPFADKRVRQAMTHLINRQRICDDVYLGYARPTSGPFHELNEQAHPDIEPWPYDLERGIALLEAAGFRRDNNGVMLQPNGEPFTISLSYPSGGATYQRIVLMIKDDMARAGISMQPEPLEWGTLIQKLNTRDFDAITLGWSASLESDLFQIFHSSQAADQGDNFINYANPELDEVIEQARNTLDRDRRIPLWQKAHAILHEDQPYTFMIRRKGLLFMDKRIMNVQETDVGLNFISTWATPCPWYVPRQMQLNRSGL